MVKPLDREWTRQPQTGSARESVFSALWTPAHTPWSVGRIAGRLSSQPTAIAPVSNGLVASYSGSTDASATVEGINKYPIVAAWHGRFVNGGNNWVGIAIPGGGGGAGDLFAIRLGTGSQVEFVSRNSFGTTADLFLSVPGGTSIGVDLVVIAQSLSATDHRLYCNGQMVTASTNVGAVSSAKTVVWLSQGALGAANHSTYWAAVGNTALSDADALHLTNEPWSVFDKFRRPTFSGVASAGASNTIAVPAEALVFTGNVPTVVATANQTVAVPAGSLTLTGFAPTVTSSASQTIQVPAGSLTLTAQVPTVIATENQTIAVPAGSLSLTGLAPTIVVNANNTVQVPAGALSLTALAPSVVYTANNVVGVPAGALSLTGYAPTISNGEVTVSVGGGYDEPKKKRYIVKQGDKLVITTSAKKAVAAADQAEDADEVAESAQAEAAEPSAPEVVELPIADIKAQAKVYEQEAKVLEMFKRKQYEQAVQLYEALVRQQDEEDVELLLMSL